MTNFSINFSNPWLLLLLIPAIVFALVPYFRMDKKYRGTRNHIVSIVLHTVIMLLSITVLAGIAIDYDKPNKENEVLLVVDASLSGEENENDRNNFIKTVVDSGNSMFRLGIVSFGFDQVYAVKLTDDMSSVYANYLNAPKPDRTATDIDAALNYSASLFENPETARIILLTDAVETDGTVANTIKSIAAKGITVDTVFFPEDRTDSEVQIISIELPDERLEVGDKFDIEITLQSSFAGSAEIVAYDNDVPGSPIKVDLKSGIQSVKVPCEFLLPGMHELSFSIESDGDTLSENNHYSSYVYLEIFDRILILEGTSNESAALTRMLAGELNVTVTDITDIANVPETVDELRQYDEVILCNVANADMPEGFAERLQTYVYDFGGGLLTVCGHEPDSNPTDDHWEAHAYTKEDMAGSVYQDMLPAEVTEYTPPAAIMILIDVSGSMYTDKNNNPLPESQSKLKFAIDGAKACVGLLNERDYIGIMTLADDYTEVLELTPSTQRAKIFSALENIETGAGTVFSTALERAGKALSAMDNVEKKHIIMITDGEPSGMDADRYKYWFEENAKLGITTSIVGVQCDTIAKGNMKRLLVDYAGVSEDNFHDVTTLGDATGTIEKDFEVNKIKTLNHEPFTPKIETTTSITAGISQEEMPMLDGFFGLKLKDGAHMILSGRFAPLYSYWQYGEGRVGTFACDLSGVWSSSFIDTPVATKLMKNIVLSLLPNENLRPHDIELTYNGDNYKTELNIFTELSKDDYIEVTVNSPASGGITPEPQHFTLDSTQSASKLTFAVKTPGIHEIVVQKKDSSGAVIAENTIYKLLSYSKEYDCFADDSVASDLIVYLAEAGNGTLISDPLEVYRNAVTYRHIHIDPRIPFIITAIVLLLLDIAARKFKWKWPHELVRDRRVKKEMERRATEK